MSQKLVGEMPNIKILGRDAMAARGNDPRHACRSVR